MALLKLFLRAFMNSQQIKNRVMVMTFKLSLIYLFIFFARG